MNAYDGRRYALLSVFEKKGIVDFAVELVRLGWSLIASGGTAKELRAAGLAVIDTTDLIGEAILGHRVVTLSREIAAGLLAANTPEDQAELARHNIRWIDLVCVDLYPMEQLIAKAGVTEAEVIEMTDVGGPTMLREGAKGRRIVISESDDRQMVLDWLKAGEPEAIDFRRHLAAKAEFVCARYCLASAEYHSQGEYAGLIGRRAVACKYGENAWQAPAALYTVKSDDPLALDKFELVAGTPPSYNNLCDLDRLLQTITHMVAGFALSTVGDPAGFAVGVKHGNACGAAVGYPKAALTGMIDGDPRAIFGGLVMTSWEVDEELAEILLTHRVDHGRRILDGIAAPSFTEGAIKMLGRKGDKCRFLANPALGQMTAASLDARPRHRQVRGGFLRQPNYTFVPNLMALIGGHAADFHLWRDLTIAWAVGSTSNSNAITLAANGKLLGNGVGQQDRVGAAELAIKRARDAGHETRGAKVYSDSFFPFTDGPLVLAEAGVETIFATSGSVNDNAVRAACEQLGVRFVTLPDAEARGFFGH